MQNLDTLYFFLAKILPLIKIIDGTKIRLLRHTKKIISQNHFFKKILKNTKPVPFIYIFFYQSKSGTRGTV